MAVSDRDGVKLEDIFSLHVGEMLPQVAKAVCLSFTTATPLLLIYFVL